MLVQAKAGTGKTLVFGILASKILHETEKTRKPQVLIVAPTREIASQIYETVRLLIPRTFWAGLFVGGTEVSKDVELLKKGCQIAIGTCGRVAQLTKMKMLSLSEVQLFVLDEADKLMEEDFVKQVK
jgi:superfamily II DNA/RNA helicase